MNDEILMKEKLSIFNNLAKSGESKGRLSVFYNVYPAPAIFWEFEVESKDIDFPKYDGDGKIITPFECNAFSIVDPYLYSNDEIKANLSTRKRITGNTTKAILGDQSIIGKSFIFYLPNAKFQSIGMSGKNFWVKETTYKKTDKSTEFGGWYREGYVEASIQEGISLTLHTTSEAIEWLRGRRSIGTYLTTLGELSVRNDISTGEAVDLLDDIAQLLSFANGGWTAPIVVELNEYDPDREIPAVYTAFEVDPIERITTTWLDYESDIIEFLKCLPTFRKMLQSDEWKANYYLILMWYFQAIQPLGIQLGGKPWPIVANALGAALEKLARIILVDEQKKLTKTKFGELNLEERIRGLLKEIGIDIVGPNYSTNDPNIGAKDAIWWFTKMRNDATHSKSSKKWTAEEATVILGNAIQWVEETLLWRLGYQGGYCDRSRRNLFLESPRYKLETRNKDW